MRSTSFPRTIRTSTTSAGELPRHPAGTDAYTASERVGIQRRLIDTSRSSREREREREEENFNLTRSRFSVFLLSAIDTIIAKSCMSDV